MTLPTPEELDAEADRQYLLSHHGVADDSAAMAPSLDAEHWRDIREHVLSEWTSAVFSTFFPTAGDLAADDTVLIEYWNDIKQQIAGGTGRWSWDTPPGDLAP